MTKPMAPEVDLDATRELLECAIEWAPSEDLRRAVEALDIVFAELRSHRAKVVGVEEARVDGPPEAAFKLGDFVLFRDRIWEVKSWGPEGKLWFIKATAEENGLRAAWVAEPLLELFDPPPVFEKPAPPESAGVDDALADLSLLEKHGGQAHWARGCYSTIRSALERCR